MGRTSAGTARLWEDQRGLWIEFDIPDTTTGRDALEEIKQGLLDGMSIAFTDPVDRYAGGKGGMVREISRAKLRAVTLTAYPAYPQTVGKLTAKAPLGTAKRAQQDADADRRRRLQHHLPTGGVRQRNGGFRRGVRRRKHAERGWVPVRLPVGRNLRKRPFGHGGRRGL